MGKRKNPYVPGLAQIYFKPDFDWEEHQAEKLYHEANHKILKTNQILFEDCIEGMKNLPEESVDLVIADPPFGIDFDGKGSQYNRKQDFVIGDYGEVVDNYYEFSSQWISQLPRLMKDTSSAYIFSGWTNLKDILIALDKHKLTLINHIIWKYQFGVFTKRKYVSSHYHVLFVVKNPKKYFFNKIEHYPLDIWDIPRKYAPGQEKNGTKLPENVVERAINFSSKPGDLIFDPFMGNGTTAICAKTTYRHYFGYEKNDKMGPLLQKNCEAVKLGQNYRPYHTFLPSLVELAKKYPAIKTHLRSNKKENPNAANPM